MEVFFLQLLLLPQELDLWSPGGIYYGFAWRCFPILGLELKFFSVDGGFPHSPGSTGSGHFLYYIVSVLWYHCMLDNHMGVRSTTWDSDPPEWDQDGWQQGRNHFRLNLGSRGEVAWLLLVIVTLKFLGSDGWQQGRNHFRLNPGSRGEVAGLLLAIVTLKSLLPWDGRENINWNKWEIFECNRKFEYLKNAVF